MVEDDQHKFDNAIHLVLQWKLALPIVQKYLTRLQKPVAKLKGQYSSCRDGTVNHCIRESSLLVRQALCVGAKVMLSTNFIVQLKVMNGLIREVKKIVYEMTDGPATDNALPAYIVVDFPNSKLPVSLISGMPKTWIPIPCINDCCKKNCCSIKNIPLCVCIAITIHKS